MELLELTHLLLEKEAAIAAGGGGYSDVHMLPCCWGQWPLDSPLAAAHAY